MNLNKYAWNRHAARYGEQAGKWVAETLAWVAPARPGALCAAFGGRATCAIERMNIIILYIDRHIIAEYSIKLKLRYRIDEYVGFRRSIQ
jgi:hypothetical protein